MLKDNTYFSVAHPFVVYLEPWEASQGFPEPENIKHLQSIGLKLVNEVKEVESNCLLQVRKMENDAKSIVDYLNLQSRKIDLVLYFMLEQEVRHGQSCSGTHFGGSGFHVKSNTALQKDSYFKANIFIRDELVNLICIAKVTDCNKTEKNPDYEVSFDFKVILSTDIEQLVQASLRVQQRLLKTNTPQIQK